MNRIFGIMVLLLITVIGQSWADEPKYQAMTVKGIQQLLNKNVGRFTVSQQAVIANGEEKSEYVVSCSAESGDLMFYESQLSYCLNQHLATTPDIEADTGLELQPQTITLNKGLSWSQFDFGRDQKVRDLQKEAVINRDGDQKRDVVIGGLSTSVGNMQKDVTSINSTNNWQNGILFALFVGLGVVTFYLKNKLRHRRSSYNNAYGYYGLNPEPKPDVNQVEKKLAENADKRLSAIQNSVDERVNKRVEEKMCEAYELLRLEFAPTPPVPTLNVPAIDPDKPVNPKDIAKWDPAKTDPPPNVGTAQIVETTKLEVIPSPDNFSLGIIEPEVEIPSQATEIMSDEIVVGIDVESEEVERKNDPTADGIDDLVEEELVDDLPASFMDCEDTDVKKSPRR